MVLKFNEFIEEGLWSKGLERAQTGEERLGEKMWYHNGSKYIKLFMKNNNAQNYKDLCKKSSTYEDLEKYGYYKEIDFETIAIIVGRLMEMYPNIDFTGKFFYSGYSGYSFNDPEFNIEDKKKLLILMVKINDLIYWSVPFNDEKYMYRTKDDKFTEEDRIEAIDYMVETAKEYFNL